MSDLAEKLLYQTSKSGEKGMEGYHTISSGLGAGFLAQIIVSPLNSLIMMIHTAKALMNSGKFWSETISNDTFGNYIKHNLSMCFIASPQTAVKYFTVAEVSKLLSSTKEPRPLRWKQYYLIGTVSGFFCRSIFYPFEVISKKKEQSNKGFLDLVRLISKNEGFTGFWTGYFPMLCRTLPADGLQFSVYSTMKGYFKKYTNVTPLKCAAISAFSETLSYTLQYPFEYVSRTQKKEGFSVRMGTIIGKEGFIGLYHGYTAHLITDVPYITLQTFFMEEAKLAISGMKRLNLFQKKPTPHIHVQTPKPKRESFRDTRKPWF